MNKVTIDVQDRGIPRLLMDYVTLPDLIEKRFGHEFVPVILQHTCESCETLYTHLGHLTLFNPELYATRRTHHYYTRADSMLERGGRRRGARP
jgi:hypothetical protein